MDYKNVVANAITNSFFQEISEYSTKQRTYIKEQEESYTDKIQDDRMRELRETYDSMRDEIDALKKSLRNDNIILESLVKENKKLKKSTNPNDMSVYAQNKREIEELEQRIKEQEEQLQSKRHEALKFYEDSIKTYKEDYVRDTVGKHIFEELRKIKEYGDELFDLVLERIKDINENLYDYIMNNIDLINDVGLDQPEPEPDPVKPEPDPIDPEPEPDPVEPEPNPVEPEPEPNPIEPEPVMPTDIKPAPKKTWKTIASLVGGIGVGAAVAFGIGPVGVAVTTIAGGLLKRAAQKRLNTLRRQRLTGETICENIEEPSNDLKSKWFKFWNEERTRDLLWGLNSVIYSGAGFSIAKSIYTGLGFGQKNMLDNTQTQVTPDQITSQQPSPSVDSSLNQASSSTDGFKIGDDLSGYDMTVGNDTALGAARGIDNENLIQSIMNQDGVHVGKISNVDGKNIIGVQSGNGTDLAWITEEALKQGGRTR